MRFWTATTVRGAIACLTACLATSSVSSVTAQALCGATILEDFRLDHDLACAGDAFTVGADDIKIDLNGHALTGDGTGTGIIVTGRTGVSIQGGTIGNFAVGVRLNTSTDIVIRQMEFAGDREGVDMQAGSIGNTIKDSAFHDSAVRAIMLRGDVLDNDIRNNVFTDNRIGILVFAGDDNRIRGNRVSGSSLAGFRINVFAGGNLFRENVVSSGAAGIEFLVTPTGSATGNDFRENRIQTNTCGILGPTAGNTFRDNSFQGNSADTCS